MTEIEEPLRPGERFHVYQFFEDGSYERVREFAPIQSALEGFAHYCTSVAARNGVTVRVILVDMGDLTVAEWTAAEGVIHPPRSEWRDFEKVYFGALPPIPKPTT